MRKHPRIPTLIKSATYVITIFIKFSRIGFPGIQVKILISRDSASLTESETVLGLEEIQEKNVFGHFYQNFIHLWNYGVIFDHFDHFLIKLWSFFMIKFFSGKIDTFSGFWGYQKCVNLSGTTVSGGPWIRAMCYL